MYSVEVPSFSKNREDGRDLFKELRDKGFQTPRSWDELAGIKSGKVFAVPYPVDTPLPAERGDLLARASLKGIELLDQNKNGFFMMIEGSQLDDYGHFNDIDLLMQETHDLTVLSVPFMNGLPRMEKHW